MKLHIGHGGHMLDGWRNLEQHQCDITKPLEFKDSSADFILIEHVLEHVTPQQAYRFLQEAHRILRSGGVIRVIVPDIVKLWIECDESYLALLKSGLKDWYPAIGRPAPPPDFKPDVRDAIEALVFCHGHQAVYSEEILEVIMQSTGFRVVECYYGCSKHPELNGVDSHWKYMGLKNCVIESSVVEGTKP